MIPFFCLKPSVPIFHPEISSTTIRCIFPVRSKETNNSNSLFSFLGLSNTNGKLDLEGLPVSAQSKHPFLIICAKLLEKLAVIMFC